MVSFWLKWNGFVFIISDKHSSKKWNQSLYKPGSVLAATLTASSVCHLSNPSVTRRLKRSTLHLGRATLIAMVYMNLQSPAGTARRSPGVWWSLTLAFSPLPHLISEIGGGCFLLPSPAVTNSFYFRKWSALYCPDFPLAAPSTKLKATSDRPRLCIPFANVNNISKLCK